MHHEYPPEPAFSEHPSRQKLAIALAFAAAIPALAVRVSGSHPEPLVASILFGLAVVGGAFLLAWAAEVAQLDISAGLALALLALIAVLPEYAVDFVFTWKAGDAFETMGTCEFANTNHCENALANMTGGNQLLIGVGWSLVVLLAAWRMRQARAGKGPRNFRPDTDLEATEVELERSHAVEISFLVLATIYGLTLPLKETLTMWDAAVLVFIFGAYMVRIARAPAEEPHLVGPAQLIATLPEGKRRACAMGLALAAIIIILAVAEPFAEGLVEVGEEFGINEFVLISIVAPLASESPELLVAAMFAWRLNTNAGLGALVSSKVNQWTLLVGTLPIVFAISSASSHGLPIGAEQREELWVTAAQSAFAVAVLMNRRMSVGEAITMFVLYIANLASRALPGGIHDEARVSVGIVYLLLAAALLVRNRRAARPLLRDGFRTPYSELAAPASELA
ncbi:MAG: sodium:proton exchanger [Actinomycetota bacterium]